MSEGTIVSWNHEEQGLTPDAISLYKAIVADPERSEDSLTEVTGLDGIRLRAALSALRSHRLVTYRADGKSRWMPVGPEQALAELLADEESRLRRRQRVLQNAKAEILSLNAAYIHALRSRDSGETIEVLRGRRRAVVGLLALHAHQAVKQLEVALPSFLDVATLMSHSPSHVNLRLVAAKAGALNGISSLAKCEFRTVPTIALWMLIFDRRLAILPAGGSSGDGVALVRHPTVVASLGANFELLWESATPLPPPSADKVLQDIRIDVLQHLAAGLKDEVIARRLGLSVRTCRRYIAEIMEYLGATSRFQAGVLARRHLLDSLPGEDPHLA